MRRKSSKRSLDLQLSRLTSLGLVNIEVLILHNNRVCLRLVTITKG
jgi:hypothetical protein